MQKDYEQYLDTAIKHEQTQIGLKALAAIVERVNVYDEMREKLQLAAHVLYTHNLGGTHEATAIRALLDRLPKE